MAMLADGGWQMKPCCVLVDRLPDDSCLTNQFLVEEKGDDYCGNRNTLHMQTPKGRESVDDMAVSEDTNSELPSDELQRKPTTVEEKSPNPRKHYAVIKSNSAPDLHSLLNSAASNANHTLSSPKRNSIDLCCAPKEAALDDISTSADDQSYRETHSLSNSFLDANESKRIYPKRKCAFYFNYGRPKWNLPKSRKVPNQDNSGASPSDQVMTMDTSQKNLEKSESDTELWSNDIRENESSMCLSDKADSETKVDSNLENTGDFKGKKECDEPDQGGSSVYLDTQSFKGSFPNQSSFASHSSFHSGNSVEDECHQDLQASRHKSAILQNRFGYGNENGGLNQSGSACENRNFIRDYPRTHGDFYTMPKKDGCATKIKKSKHSSSLDNVPGSSRKSSNLYAIVPQENKDYNRTVITIQRAGAIGKVKKFRRKRGHRKRLLTPPGKIPSLKSDNVLKLSLGQNEGQAAIPQEPSSSSSYLQKSTSEQVKKKKPTALSVYTQINDGIIKYVCCKRYKKRSRRGPVLEYKFPKSESSRTRKHSENKQNREIAETICPQAELSDIRRPESIEDIVHDVVNEIVDCVFQESVKRTEDLDMSCENYKIKDLLQKFCAEFGFRWSEFHELGDPETFCKTLSVTDTNLDGTYSIPASGRRMYYRRKFSLKRPLEELTENEDSQIAWTVKKRRKNMAAKNVVKRFFTRSAARSLASSCDSQGYDLERTREERPSVTADEVVCGRKKVKQSLEERYKTLNHIKSAPDISEDEDRAEDDVPLVIDESVGQPDSPEAVSSAEENQTAQEKMDSSRTGEGMDNKMWTPCDATESAGKSSSHTDVIDVIEDLVRSADMEVKKDEAIELQKKQEEKIVMEKETSIPNKCPVSVKLKCIVPPPKKVKDDMPRKLPLILPKQTPPIMKKPKQLEAKPMKPTRNVLKIPTMQPKVYPPLLPRPPQPGPSAAPITAQQPLVVSVCAKPLNPPVVVPIHKEPNPLPSKPIHPLPVHPCHPSRTDEVRHPLQRKGQLREMPDQPLDLRIKTETKDDKGSGCKMKVPVQFVIPQLKPKANKPPSPPSLLMRSLEKPPLSKGLIPFDTPSMKERKSSPCPQSTSPMSSVKSLDLSQTETLRRKKEESILRSLLLENPPEETFGLSEKSEHCVLPIPSPSSGPVIADVFSLTHKSSETMTSCSPKLGSSADNKGSNSLEFPNNFMEKLANSEYDIFKDAKQMEGLYGSDIPLSTSFSEPDEGEWLKDPLAAREKINHLHKEILYLDMMASQKEKERLLILHFRKYKEEVMKRIFRHTVRSQLREKSRLGMISSNSGGTRASSKESVGSTPPPSERPSRTERQRDESHVSEHQHSKSQNVFSPTPLCSKEACLVRPMVVQDAKQQQQQHSRQSVGSFASIESLVAKSNDTYDRGSPDKDAVLDLTSQRMPKSASIFENTIAAHSRSSPVPGATVASARSHSNGSKVAFTPFTTIQQTNFLLNTLQGNGGAYTVHKGVDGDRSKPYQEHITLPWPPAPSSSPSGNTLLSKSNHFRESAFARPHSASSNSAFPSSISPLSKDSTTSLSVDNKDLRVPSCGDGSVDRKRNSSLHDAGRGSSANSRFPSSSLDHHFSQHPIGASYHPAIYPINGIASQLSPPGVHSLSMGVPWWFSSPDYMSKHDSRSSLSASDTRTIR